MHLVNLAEEGTPLVKLERGNVVQEGDLPGHVPDDLHPGEAAGGGAGLRRGR